MLDNKDIEKLKEVFVTKEEFEGFMETATTKDDITGIKGDINKIVNLLGKMDEKLDNVGNLNHRVEYIENTLNIQPLKTKI